MDIRQLKSFSHWRWFALVAGGIAGYAYYFYIGCLSGTCPITGNPWISTGYGAIMGWLVVPRTKNSNH